MWDLRRVLIYLWSWQWRRGKVTDDARRRSDETRETVEARHKKHGNKRFLTSFVALQ